jgi:hypothetical protein
MKGKSRTVEILTRENNKWQRHGKKISFLRHYVIGVSMSYSANESRKRWIKLRLPRLFCSLVSRMNLVKFQDENLTMPVYKRHTTKSSHNFITHIRY